MNANMKRTITLALCLALLSSACACGGQNESTETETGAGTGTEAVTGTEAASESTSAADTESEPPAAPAAMELNKYMSYLVRYFHEPYSLGDDISKKDILSVCFQTALFNKDSLDFVELDEDQQVIYIEGEGMRKIAKNLFGDEVVLEDYHGFMEGSADFYIADVDKYCALYAREWVGDPYNLNENTMIQIIKETDSSAVVRADVEYRPNLLTVESSREMEYVFDKIEDGGFTYYRLTEVREAV